MYCANNINSKIIIVSRIDICKWI